MVHGFKGTSYDLRLFKNIISLLYPTTDCLCAVSNEFSTDKKIEELGKNLANEVSLYVEDKKSKSDPILKYFF